MIKDDNKMLISLPANFAAEEDGAVTVDWVVLTAAIIGLAALSAQAILNATVVLGGSVSSEVAAKTVSNGN